MAGTQKVGAHQHDTTCAGIWACCIRHPNTTARNCTDFRAPLYLPLWPVTQHSVCWPVSGKKFFLWLEPAVEAMCQWKTFVSSQCVRITVIVANILDLSPSPGPTTLFFLQSDAGDGRRWSQVLGPNTWIVLVYHLYFQGLQLTLVNWFLNSSRKGQNHGWEQNIQKYTTPETSFGTIPY